jgi:hypothetical protein
VSRQYLNTFENEMQIKYFRDPNLDSCCLKRYPSCFRSAYLNVFKIRCNKIFQKFQFCINSFRNFLFKKLCSYFGLSIIF